MVGLLGFLILAVGGGALALYLGVPPLYIGAYVLGLLLLGAITGFSTGSRGGGGSSGGGGGGGSSKSKTGKAMDAANGFLDSLSGSSGGSGSNRSTGSVSRSNSDNRREVGSFGNPRGEDSSSAQDSGRNDSNPSNSDGGGTTEEDYLNPDTDNEDMPLGDLFSSGEDAAESEIEELEQLLQAIDQEEQDIQELHQLDESLKDDIRETIQDLKDLIQHEERINQITDGQITVQEILKHNEEISGDLRGMRGDVKETREDIQSIQSKLAKEQEDVEDLGSEMNQIGELIEYIGEHEGKLMNMENRLDQVLEGELDMRQNA